MDCDFRLGSKAYFIRPLPSKDRQHTTITSHAATNYEHDLWAKRKMRPSLPPHIGRQPRHAACTYATCGRICEKSLFRVPEAWLGDRRLDCTAKAQSRSNSHKSLSTRFPFPFWEHVSKGRVSKEKDLWKVQCLFIKMCYFYQ